MKEKNDLYFSRYPKDQKLCQKIADHLRDNKVLLANGQRYTTEQFQQLGLLIGTNTSFDELHYFLEQAFLPNNPDKLSSVFLHKAMLGDYESQPIYTVLHESIYCQGFKSDWSAARIREENPEFNYKKGSPFLFTGEMIFPFMFDEYKALLPMKKAADILAQKDDWSLLYDVSALNMNDVPCAAAVYENDMFVEREFSLETAREVKGMKVWTTNEYEHDGLREDGARILRRLIDMARGMI